MILSKSKLKINFFLIRVFNIAIIKLIKEYLICDRVLFFT